MGRRSPIKSVTDLFTLVVESWCHIGDGEWKERLFWQKTKHVENYNNFNWSATNTLMSTAQWKEKQHWSANLLNCSRRSILFWSVPVCWPFFPSRWHAWSAHGMCTQTFSAICFPSLCHAFPYIFLHCPAIHCLYLPISLFLFFQFLLILLSHMADHNILFSLVFLSYLYLALSIL